MGNKGFTLIETVVVIAILAILSFFGVENVIEFQKDSLLANTANEIASNTRQARTKSLNGELLGGEKPEDFTADGLPQYGIKINGQSYSLFRQYQRLSDSALQTQTIATFNVDNNLSLIPDESAVIFDRKTGENSPATFILKRKDNRGTQSVEIGVKGVVVQRI